ncbi:MAG TPA: TonB-dependent receptor [Nevskiaceae bacterium]|nr:TonB-dependent receptor [Nevskiaceae bacterium]
MIDPRALGILVLAAVAAPLQAQEGPEVTEPAVTEPASEAPADETVATVPVDAAEDPAETPLADDEGGGSRLMQEIIVTAQKREENLQDVPISVQAFTADALDAKGIEEPKALQLSTPGLSYNVFAGYSLIYIRGVGTDAFIPSADASVATYIDNIYYPFGHSLASALGNIERVEVLKGPQGTLFGRNSTGGAINIVTKQPGPDFESSVTMDFESHDKRNFRAFVNIPVVDGLALSVSGLHYGEDTYYELASSSPRDELPRETSRAFSVKAGLTPIDELTATVGYTWINSRGGNSMSLPAHDVKPLGALAGVTESPDYVTSEDAPVYIDTTARVVTADVKYSAPWFDTRALYGHQDIVSPALADYDGSSQPLTTFESKGQFAKVDTGELQVLSNSDSPLSDWLTWIGGVYYIDSSAGYDPLYFSLAPDVLPGIGQLLVNYGLPQSAAPVLDAFTNVAGLPVLGPYLDQLVNTGASLSLQGVLDTESTAGFFQTTAHLTETLALTIGGRYQVEDRKLAKSTVGLRVAGLDEPVQFSDFNAQGNLLGTNAKQKAHTTNFSPKATIDWKFVDDSMLYATFSQGFKSGTFNIISIYAPTQYIEPEKTTTYEIGYKGELLDRSLRLNAAIFQNSIEDLQVQTISLTSGGAVRFETAGKARIRGADFDILWEVLPESLPGLVFTAGGAYLKGEYTDYQDGSGFDEQTGLFFQGRDFTGNKLVRTPKFSGNVGLAYTLDFDNSAIEVAADTYHNSGSYYSAQNTASSRESSYTLVNARISYYYEPWGTRFTVFGKNINDAEYHYVLQDLDFGTARLLAPDAFYGAKIQWEFQ